MIGTLIAAAVVLAWLSLAVVYIVRQRRAAKSCANPICIGCPGAASCARRARELQREMKREKRALRKKS